MLDNRLDIELLKVWKGKVIDINRGIRLWKVKASKRREERESTKNNKKTLNYV